MPKMDAVKPYLYLISLVIVVVAMISINELGYGIIAFVLLMAVAYWLMLELFEKKKPK
jgi:hypothetical protein